MIVYCDVDGVVLDLVRHICDHHRLPKYSGNDWNLAAGLGMDADVLWAPTRETSFWYSAPKEPHADKLVKVLKGFGTGFRFCTASFPFVWSYAGKVEWLLRNYPWNKIQMITDKWELAAPDRLLIDDKEDTVSRWVGAGGIGILWPQPWNSNRGANPEEILAAIASRRLSSVSYRC